ncbi:MAG: CDP-6-deoxy-L-threo-D-glycero-4-hexulose-3-dehydrase reductase, partial [Rhizobacter sp.]|nr:CDP-6-deoxy-L-threo-D-glycero-4-hexulose-3-dehydrase reductase [Rhizobacter sp.]
AAMLAGLSGQAASKPESVTVYWGGRVAADHYWQPPPELAFDLRYVPVLSRAGDDWAGARGHVQDVMLAESPLLAHTVVYACGSDVMIENARSRLVEAGLPSKGFYSDAFLSSSP